MTENERRGSQKNRWTRWYMWLAYGGGVLGVVAAVFVIVTMAAAPSSNGETAASYRNMATLTPTKRLRWSADTPASAPPLKCAICNPSRARMASLSMSP